MYECVVGDGGGSMYGCCICCHVSGVSKVDGCRDYVSWVDWVTVVCILDIVDLSWAVAVGGCGSDWAGYLALEFCLTAILATAMVLIGWLRVLAGMLVTVLMMLCEVRLVILLKTARPKPSYDAGVMAMKNRELPAPGLVPVTVSRQGWLNRNLGRNLLVKWQFGFLALALSGLLFRTTNLGTIWRKTALLHSGEAAPSCIPGLAYLRAFLVSLMKPPIAPGVRLGKRPTWTLFPDARRAVARLEVDTGRTSVWGLTLCVLWAVF